MFPMPAWLVATSGEHRDRQLADDEYGEGRQEEVGREEEDKDDPGHLHGSDADGEADVHDAPGRVGSGGTQPLRGQGQPHDDVTQRDHRPVARFARRSDAGGDDDGARHLDEAAIR
jgi:hypothetical protein